MSLVCVNLVLKKKNIIIIKNGYLFYENHDKFLVRVYMFVYTCILGDKK